MNKLLVLGLDCAEPSLVFDELRPRLKVLSRLAESGTFGRLRSCDPPITCPAWMVSVTGTSPGELGIYGFRNRTDHSYAGLGLATSSWVKHETVWDVLTRNGRKSITYGVPLTFPPKPLNGCQVGCFLTPGHDANYTYPANLKDELAAATAPYIPDVRGYRTEDKSALLKSIYEMTDNHTRQIKWLLKNKPWDFFMSVEMGIDRIHHGFWRYHDAKHPRHDPDPKLRHCIRDYYAHVDAALGSIIDDVPDDTAIAVMSDHGIQQMAGGLAFNEWLIREGYLVLKNRPTAQTPLAKCEIDWSKTRAWGDGGYYGRLFINIKGREPQGTVAAEQLEAFKAELTAKIKAIPDHTGKAMDTRVYRPQELYPHVNGVAPDLIIYFDNLNWRSIGSVGMPNASIYTFENDSGPDDANHAQDGIFILTTKARYKNAALKGPGEQKNLNLRDMARTFLGVLGIPPAASMGGTAIQLPQ